MRAVSGPILLASPQGQKPPQASFRAQWGRLIKGQPTTGARFWVQSKLPTDEPNQFKTGAQLGAQLPVRRRSVGRPMGLRKWRQLDAWDHSGRRSPVRVPGRRRPDGPQRGRGSGDRSLCLGAPTEARSGLCARDTQLCWAPGGLREWRQLCALRRGGGRVQFGCQQDANPLDAPRTQKVATALRSGTSMEGSPSLG